MYYIITETILPAWPVNFNLNLGFFDTSIRGLRNLVDFALKSPNPTPPRFLFISSIGVLRRMSSRLLRCVRFADYHPQILSGISELKRTSLVLIWPLGQDTASQNGLANNS